MRARVPACLACLLLAGCGGGEPGNRAPEPRVTLRLTAPADAAVVRAGTVEIRGRVSPARAGVTVLGREAAVKDGTFVARVALEPGANVIDVAATATGRRAAFAALRIVREVRVPVPGVIGDDADTATERLEALGLKVERRSGGGLFDPLLPGEPRVCAVLPDPGTLVRPGATVRVTVARDCD